jgi:hypothetical protein
MTTMRKRKEKCLRPIIEHLSLEVVEQNCNRVQK